MDTMKAIVRRKSTRDFSAEQIPHASLDAILASGCAAPVAVGRYDTLHLTVIQNKEVMEDISQAGSKMMACEKSNRKRRSIMQSDTPKDSELRKWSVF